MKQLTHHQDGDRIATALLQLPRVHAALVERGFGVSRYVHGSIESLRSRPPEEKPIDAYLAEVAREAAFVPRGSWTVEKRTEIPDSAKSSYLSMLHARRLMGDQEYLAREPGAHYSLDPNECLYKEMGIEKPHLRLKHLKEVSLQKAADVARWTGAIQRWSVKGRDVTVPALKAFLKAACENYGMEYKQMKSEGETLILVSRSVGVGLECGFTWTDFNNLKKWGRSAIDFSFRSTDGSGNRGAVLYARRMGQLLPGGDLYMGQNKGWPTACLSFLFALNLVDVLCKEFFKDERAALLPGSRVA